MNKYESVIIINPALDDEAVKKLEATFTDLINKDGKVEKVDEMGKKNFGSAGFSKCNLS